MNSLVCSVTALLAFGAASHSPDDLGWRIAGGSKASPRQFPYIISLRDFSGSRVGSHFCGGSIIDTDWILTAAHCLEGKSPNNIIVVVGTNLINGGGIEHKVQRIISHKKYDSKNIKNDIALLKLSIPITVSSTVQIIPLETYYVKGCVSAILAGWGDEYKGGSTPTALNFIDLTTINIEDCKHRMYPMPVSHTQICTFTAEGEGACAGDSGGPLVANGRQIGIVSYGRPCALAYPDVFTRVSSYSSWIQSIIA